MDEEELKKLLKDHDKELLIGVIDKALQNWMEKKFAQFGKWTAGGILVMVMVGVVYLYVHSGMMFK